MSDVPTQLDNLPLPVIDTEGNPVERRIRDVMGARSLYFNLRQADFETNRQMARHQAMADGEPPYSQQERNQTGQAYLANFNPNDFKYLLDTSLGSFTDLISASEAFIDLWTKFGPEEYREQWSEIMSRNMSRVIRSWPRFIFQWGYIPHYFTLHGVGIAYFEDNTNWQWSVSNLSMMKIPRQTPACEEEIEYGFVKSYQQPHKLVQIVNKGAVSEEEGWNLEAVKRALLNTTSNSVSLYSWTELEARIKDNDIVWGYNNPTISLLYGWVRENDGTYSIVVLPENAPGGNDGAPEEFMCYKRGAYASAEEAFIFFTRGIGTNGTYHSIRGLAADIYNSMQALMRLRNREVDIAFECGPTWQLEDEEAVDTAQLSPWGAGMLVSKGLKLLQVTAPQLSATTQPAIQSLERTIQNNSGTYTSSANSIPAEREMSAREFSGRLEQLAGLSVTEISLFNQSMDRLAREIVRRFTRKNYQRVEPGGHYVAKWRAMCIAEGVPPEALEMIDHDRTRAARVIGFGSPAARITSLQKLMELWPYYDELGRARLVRDLTASIAGWEKADAYAPAPSAAARPPIDKAIADLQNSVLIGGGTATIQPNENKRIHLEQHLGAMQQFIDQFDQAGQNPELYQQIVPPLDALYEHAAATLEVYDGPDAKQFRQALQNAGEILVNGTRHLQKLQQQQMEEAQQQAQDSGQPYSPESHQQQIEKTMEMQQRIAEFDVRMQIMQKESEAAIMRENQKQQAELARQDAKAKADILMKQQQMSLQSPQGQAA